MASRITIRRIGLATVAAAVAALAMLVHAAPSRATICPSGTVVPEYCVLTPNFSTLILGDNPIGYFRMDDPSGASTMANFAPGRPDGEYKNGQDSGPVGVSADGDTARDFWGTDGYGYVNDLPAPGNGYTSYTVEAWFRLADTDGNPNVVDDGTIVQFGRGAAIYIQDGLLTFRNGDDVAVDVTTQVKDETWYMVVGRKSGGNIALYVNESPSSPTPFQSTSTAHTTSTYLPYGSPTFYVGYGEYAPWFDGAIDEVAYFQYALPIASIAQHFYADPAPPTSTMAHHVASGSSAAPAPAGSSSAGTFSANSSTPAAAKSPERKPAAKRSPLAVAKTQVKQLTAQLTKAKAKLRALKRHHAKKRTIAAAERQVRALTKKLAKAKARVKSLRPKKRSPKPASAIGRSST
jgi:hypothetical protein